LITKPKSFECFKKDEFLKDMTLPSWLTEDNQVNKVSRWVPCDAFEICNFNNPYINDRSLFRTSSSNGDITNFYDRKMIFCDDFDRTEYWLPIAMYVGMFFSLLIVPSIADKYGRRNVYCICLATSMLA